MFCANSSFFVCAHFKYCNDHSFIHPLNTTRFSSWSVFIGIKCKGWLQTGILMKKYNTTINYQMKYTILSHHKSSFIIKTFILKNMSPLLLNNIRLFDAIAVERQALKTSKYFSFPSCQKSQKTLDCNEATIKIIIKNTNKKYQVFPRPEWIGHRF